MSLKDKELKELVDVIGMYQAIYLRTFIYNNAQVLAKPDEIKARIKLLYDYDMTDEEINEFTKKIGEQAIEYLHHELLHECIH